MSTELQTFYSRALLARLKDPIWITGGRRKSKWHLLLNGKEFCGTSVWYTYRAVSGTLRWFDLQSPYRYHFVCQTCRGEGIKLSLFR